LRLDRAHPGTRQLDRLAIIFDLSRRNEPPAGEILASRQLALRDRVLRTDLGEIGLQLRELRLDQRGIEFASS
jgi:hypothetical protein